ncbi:MAG: hypothetical protein ACYCXG_00365 [Acidiferrobacter sp.]
MRHLSVGVLGLVLVARSLLTLACAHAIVGMRVFPGTLTFSDPGVTDELDVIAANGTISPFPGTAPTSLSEFSLDYSKTLTRRLGLALGTDYQSVDQYGRTDDGMDDLTIGLDDLLWKSDSAETMVTVGLNATIGHSGSQAIGAPYSEVSPTVLFGRGFGDLPSAMRYLRPFAITGVFTPNIPLQSAAPRSVTYGLSFQYSLPYLQSFVRDIGLHAPFNNLVPLVELPMQTCTSGACAGQTTGTINPGFVWIGHYGQIGLEATLPMNRASGHGVGVVLGVGFYFDDIYPHTLGAPLFPASPSRDERRS